MRSGPSRLADRQRGVQVAAALDVELAVGEAEPEVEVERGRVASAAAALEDARRSSVSTISALLRASEPQGRAV